MYCYYTGQYRCNRIGKWASFGTNSIPKGKDSSAMCLVGNCMHLSALRNNCTRNSQNCTRPHLVQLLACYSYNYSLIALKCMRLPILIGWFSFVSCEKLLLISRAVTHIHNVDKEISRNQVHTCPSMCLVLKLINIKKLWQWLKFVNQ